VDKRKYQYYVIQVKYHNGDTEELNTAKAKEDINKSSYKEMLKVYNEVKELYEDKECDISFCGVGQDGNLGIMFTKECKKEKEKVKDFNYIVSLLEKVKKTYEVREDYVKTNYGLLDKKIDIILHKIEHSNEEYSLENKVKDFDNIKDLRIQRRSIKEEQALQDIIRDSNIMNTIKKILVHTEKLNKKIETTKQRIENRDEKVERNLQVQEFDYKNFKDRMRIMQEIQKQFNKITYDDNKKKIYAYNKCVGLK
jgi:hypothetical protein